MPTSNITNIGVFV